MHDLTALGLLLAGHCFADFVLQTERMILGKRENARWLLLHGGQVALAQFVPLLWILAPWEALGLALLLGALHAITDKAKVMADQRWERRETTWFVLDQLVHLGTLVMVCAWVRWGSVAGSELVLRTWAWLVAAYSFNVHGGSTVVAATLGEKVAADNEEAHRQGGRIGVLERMVVLTLVLVGEWAAIGFVLTAKSVARFKRLDEDQGFAERYLVGTLTSVIVAGATGLLLVEGCLVPMFARS